MGPQEDMVVQRFLEVAFLFALGTEDATESAEMPESPRRNAQNCSLESLFWAC